MKYNWYRLSKEASIQKKNKKDSQKNDNLDENYEAEFTGKTIEKSKYTKMSEQYLLV